MCVRGPFLIVAFFAKLKYPSPQRALPASLSEYIESFINGFDKLAVEPRTPEDPFRALLRVLRPRLMTRQARPPPHHLYSLCRQHQQHHRPQQHASRRFGMTTAPATLILVLQTLTWCTRRPSLTWLLRYRWFLSPCEGTPPRLSGTRKQEKPARTKTRLATRLGIVTPESSTAQTRQPKLFTRPLANITSKSNSNPRISWSVTRPSFHLTTSFVTARVRNIVVLSKTSTYPIKTSST